jgi:hypothetical protein
MTLTNLETMVSQIENLAASVDDSARRSLRNTLRDLQYKLEGPNNTINRFGYYVSYKYISMAR